MKLNFPSKVFYKNQDLEKVSSFIQDKVGPMGQGVGLHAGKWGLLQPVADALKLLLKEDIIPSSADKPLFILAPFMIFIGAFISFIAIPFGDSIIIADLNIGIFYNEYITNTIYININVKREQFCEYNAHNCSLCICWLSFNASFTTCLLYTSDAADE